MWLLLCSTSCNENRKKWKQPTDVSFRMDVNRSPASNGNLVFNGGIIVLERFEFDGKREQGEDVYFRNDYDELNISFDSNTSIAELDFDIPQGTYTKIEIEIETDSESDISILVEGDYTTTTGTTYPLRLELESVEIYTVVATDAGGSTEIILDTDVPATSVIMLDPAHWFGTVSASMLDDADLTDVDGAQTILINDETNEDIFDEIEDRMDEATEVIFQ
ncbi:MAG: hypothetical protein COA57_09505 [Flavobacteriales bacterium]|nr:MAG: hypothetical protein COA57_09505 [Flavobacteriales bacterium]